MNVIIYNGLMFGSTAYALWRGGLPERLVAISFVVADMLTLFTLPPVNIRFRQIDPAILTIDLVLLGVLLAIAFKANRYWTLCLCGLHLATVYAYLARALTSSMAPEALRALLSYSAHLQLLVLVAGTVRHRRRMMRLGADASWT